MHICNMDGQGGAAIGAYGLHRAMIRLGIDSKMLVIRKVTDDPTVSQVGRYRRRARNWLRRAEKLLLLLERTSDTTLRTLNIFPTGIHRLINQSDADIVQLHWIGIHTISIGEIAKIKKPVVWKMPDMWPFCGAEHYSYPEKNSRFIEGYNRHNRPRANTGLDLNKWVWRYKKWCWKRKRIHIVGTSTWIASCARESYLFRNQSIRVINNPIDLDLFRPTGKIQARQRLGLQAGKKIVLFGSWHVERDRRKGYDKLLQAMKILQKSWKPEEIVLLVFGTDKKPELTYSDTGVYEDYFQEKFLGELGQNELLRDAYNAADVYVTPSLLESFGLTAAESLACGTPVVCFDTSGLRDIVDHEVNGYRARCYDPDDLANGINWILRQEGTQFGEYSREKAERSFSSDTAVKKYIEFYEDILTQDSSNA